MFKAKKWSGLILILSLTLVFASCSKNEETSSNGDQLTKNDKLVVATSGTLYPTSYHSDETNELTGFEVEVVREMAKRLELDVEFVEMGVDGMLTSINSGTVDLAANDMDITDEREEKFQFTIPYKHSYGSAIVRADDLSGIKTLEDLKGKKAAGASTTVYMEIARKYGAEEVIYDNVTNDQYLRDVGIGRTDVILNDFYLQSLAIAAFPDLGVIIHPDLFYFPNAQAMIMKKDNKELLEKINPVIQEMLDDGTISELSKQFFSGADVSQKPDIDFE
ncbi:transporter substrate-binding domain-containing protein [Bacillus chungangensis]|uniref:Cystine transport system substrate-binding protein n=1 Tax=Bacillus chungangensis TaxID=587633 RepID=A0ABT9WPN0_9BACI|nr:transporter substrate-binding domain-containing protein [Bacillus chungangensis]MDQ0175098.1 cystine transport system substrate-binding protein [Bacillus chungangensis]